MPIFDQLRQWIALTDEELNQYRSGPFKDKAVWYLFPEDRLPKHSQIPSRVPLLPDGCLAWRRQLHHASSFVGFFCASLAKTDPLYRVTWNKPETRDSFGFETSALILGAICLSCAGFLFFPFFVIN